MLEANTNTKQKQEVSSDKFSEKPALKTRPSLPIALISFRQKPVKRHSLQGTYYHGSQNKQRKKHEKSRSKGFKFPQSERFAKTVASCQYLCKLDIPNTRSKISCSFGYGSRQPISKILLGRASLTPSPDKYSVSQMLATQGRSFPSGRQSQLRRYITHRTDVYSPHFTIDNPGPIYDVRTQINAKPITIKKRLKMFTQRASQSHSFIPGPQYYINQKTTAKKQKGSKFQMSNRMDLSEPLNRTPGPKYQILGFCDSLRKKNQI